MKIFQLLAACLVVAAPVPTLSLADSAHEYIPAAAQRAAEAELEALKGSPSLPVFGLSDTAILRDAYLDEPFKHYWAKTSFLDFDASSAEDLLQHLEGFCICFPVIRGERTLGTINVYLDEDGRYVAGERTVGDVLCTEVKKVREAVSSSERAFVTPWSSPDIVDTLQAVSEARSNASGLTPPRWLWRRVLL